MNNKKSVSVIGCGWLGFPLAMELLKSGCLVRGSTRTVDKSTALYEAGIDAYLLELPGGKIADSPLFHSDNYVINLPPGRGMTGIMDNYPKAIQAVISSIDRAKVQSLVFVSSTSVYPDDVDYIDEETLEAPSTESGMAILEAEQIIRKAGIPWTILRFGGLAGPGRHPGRFLAGRTDLSNGDQAINFLHLDDAKGVLNHFVFHRGNEQTYNVVSPIHPLKKDFYPVMARQLGLIEPEFNSGIICPAREISCRKLVGDTGYRFIHPDPMHFTY
jgi:nucleoside-diphosphate-sugar epimerase